MRPAGWLALHLVAARWNPDPREMDFIGQRLPAPLVGFFRCHRQSFRQQPNEKTDPRPRIFPRCLLSPSRRCLGRRELRGGTGKSLGGYYSHSFRERLICQGRHVMHQLSVQRHPCAIVRDETHRIDRHVGLLRNEPWQSHANNASVKPVQDACPPPRLECRFDLRKPTVEEHQLECVETDRQVKKLILLAWCAAIIADHDNLSELLQRLTGFPLRIGKHMLILGQFLSEVQCLSRSQQIVPAVVTERWCVPMCAWLQRSRMPSDRR